VRSRPDFLVLSPDDRLELAVEVKNLRGVSADWAADYRRNLLAHSILPATDFFLLALPESLFLWDNARAQGGALPHYRVSTADALGPLMVDADDEESLEAAVSTWLFALTSPSLGEEEAQRRYGWLVDSGLHARIRGGHVEYPAAA
jgi:hypothetical protein